MKFYVFQLECLDDSVDLFELEAKDTDDAYEIIDESIATNNSREILLTKEQIQELKKKIKELGL